MGALRVNQSGGPGFRTDTSGRYVCSLRIHLWPSRLLQQLGMLHVGPRPNTPVGGSGLVQLSNTLLELT